MVFNAFQINSCVLNEECKCNKNRSVDERSTHWHSAEGELSVDHITITLTIQWRRLGAGMQRVSSAVLQLQHEGGGAYQQTKAFQTSRVSPNYHLFPNKTTTCGSVYGAKCGNGEVDTSGCPF